MMTSSGFDFRAPIVTLLAALLLVGPLATGVALAGEERAGGSYRIGSGDELRIVVWRNQDLSMTVPVRPDGWISLPLVDDVEVAGFTPMQVRDRLAARLSEFVTEPIVSVIVTRVGSFSVSIIGNVRQPGRYELEGRTTVLDVLALAGGPDEFANRDGIYVLRRTGGVPVRIGVRYSDAINPGGGADVNVDVEPGDIVIVP